MQPASLWADKGCDIIHIPRQCCWHSRRDRQDIKTWIGRARTA